MWSNKSLNHCSYAFVIIFCLIIQTIPFTVYILLNHSNNSTYSIFWNVLFLFNYIFCFIIARWTGKRNKLRADFLEKHSICGLTISQPTIPSCRSPDRCRQKNKMKPTNPNADTYVEKHKFNTYLSQFPANPLVEHPDLTHWGDTLVGHPCLTLLRCALDTLAWHSSKTLLLDTLVRHFLLDTLTCHSCKTLLLDTLVGLFLLDTSYLALLTWHSSGTLLPDTLVRHSCLTDTLLQHSYLTLLYDTLTWHFLLDTLVRHSCKTLL